MNCAKCPHQGEVNAALAPCQTCGSVGARVGGAKCGACRQLEAIQKALRPCQTCEAGKLHGEVHADAGEAAKTALQYALPNDHCPTAGVTALPPDVEDALRKALCVLFQFEPMQLLLIQHVCHGRNLATFRETLAELKERLNARYGLTEGGKGFRATAHTWKKAIVSKMPTLAPFFAAVTDANAGGSRR